MNLRVIGIQTMFKAMSLGEIAEGVSVHGKEDRDQGRSLADTEVSVRAWEMGKNQ